MKNALAFLASLLCVAGAAACAETPTLAVPGAPSFTGGWVGPGGRSATDPTVVTTADGGWTAGSGNRTAGGDSVGGTSTPGSTYAAGIGMIGGGRAEEGETPTSAAGVLVGSGH
jgi:hypothetical protein